MVKKREHEKELMAEVFEVIDTLLGPNGCAWDHQQDLISVKKNLLEEVYELFEAINEKDPIKIEEELGDIFFLSLFLSRLAERDFHLKAHLMIEKVKKKYVDRHPHVFGEKKLEEPSDIEKQWDEIKKKEKKERLSLLDDLADTFPALLRAVKFLKAAKKTEYKIPRLEETEEEKIGNALFSLVKQALEKNVHPEICLLDWLNKQEKIFRSWEKSSL